jgi:CBS domain-containing protein
MGPLVSDLMETEVQTIDADQSLERAGTKLYEAGVGSLIVESAEGVPIGIVTTEDVLGAIATADRDLDSLPVRERMSRPLLTIRGDRPVRSAVREMNEQDVEQLAIVEDFEVVGVIAQADVIEAYELLIKAAHDAERQPED